MEKYIIKQAKRTGSSSSLLLLALKLGQYFIVLPIRHKRMIDSLFGIEPKLGNLLSKEELTPVKKSLKKRIKKDPETQAESVMRSSAKTYLMNLENLNEGESIGNVAYLIKEELPEISKKIMKVPL